MSNNGAKKEDSNWTLVSDELKKEILEKYTEDEIKIIKEWIEKRLRAGYVMEETDEIPGPLDSSKGGVPYMPEGKEYPEHESYHFNDDDEEEYTLPLFAQINLADAARQFGEIPGWPNHGLLQLFMYEKIKYTDDEVFGECRYYKNPSLAQQRADITDNLGEKGHTVTFTQKGLTVYRGEYPDEKFEELDQAMREIDKDEKIRNSFTGLNDEYWGGKSDVPYCADEGDEGIIGHFVGDLPGSDRMQFSLADKFAEEYAEHKEEDYFEFHVDGLGDLI